MKETLINNDHNKDASGSDRILRTPAASGSNATGGREKEAEVTGNIKQRISSFLPGKKRKAPYYEENIKTKTVFVVNVVLGFSGRVTRRLMEGYKQLFDIPEKETGNIYANLGLDFLAKADSKQAIAAFKKSLELHADNKEIFYYLGNAYFKEKDYKEAINAYLSAIAAEPENADAYFEIGLCYAGQEKHDEAMRAFKKALDLDPKNGEIYYCLGVSLDQVKDYAGAIVYFKKAIELNPRVARFYHSLGFTYECNKQHDMAIGCFKKAIELERE